MKYFKWFSNVFKCFPKWFFIAFLTYFARWYGSCSTYIRKSIGAVGYYDYYWLKCRTNWCSYCAHTYCMSCHVGAIMEFNGCIDKWFWPSHFAACVQASIKSELLSGAANRNSIVRFFWHQKKKYDCIYAAIRKTAMMESFGNQLRVIVWISISNFGKLEVWS